MLVATTFECQFQNGKKHLNRMKTDKVTKNRVGRKICSTVGHILRLKTKLRLKNSGYRSSSFKTPS